MLGKIREPGTCVSCHPSYSGGSQFKASPSKQFGDPISKKYPSQKRAGTVAPSSNPSAEKKKKKE
jgi:hypothetical protein